MIKQPPWMTDAAWHTYELLRYGMKVPGEVISDPYGVLPDVLGPEQTYKPGSWRWWWADPPETHN